MAANLNFPRKQNPWFYDYLTEESKRFYDTVLRNREYPIAATELFTLFPLENEESE